MLRTLLFALVCTITACGDDGDGQGGGGTANDPMWSPEACASRGQLPMGCTQAEIDVYSRCYVDACADTLELCYGPGYRSGSFSGPCADFVDCATSCTCSDSGCTGACPGAQACGQCLNDNVCGLDCEIPPCSIPEGAIDHTCDDLRACCAALDTTFRSTCNSALAQAEMLGSMGIFLCNSQVKFFGALTMSPACD